MSEPAILPPIKVSELLTEKFRPIYAMIRDAIYDEIWLIGGRASTKSSLIALAIISGMVVDHDANCVALRKVGDTLRDSVHSTLLWAIDALELTPHFHSTQNPPRLFFKPTSQQVVMRGMDDKRKLKSIKFRIGYAKFLWCEELDEFSGMDEIRSIAQSVLRGGPIFVQLMSYNPPRDPASWVNEEAKRRKTGRFVSHSTYLDVPAHWLGPKFIADAENLKFNHPELYEHEYMGNPVGNVERIVFWDKWEIKDFPEPLEKEIVQGRFFFGADWGYIHPTALMRCFIKDQCLWIDYEAYQTKVEIPQIPALFDTIPRSRDFRIWADSALPATISYVKMNGFRNLESVKKSTKNDKPEEKTSKENYVVDGVNYLRGAFKKIYVHPRCVNMAKEFSLYRYAIDKNTGVILPDLIDENNHAIDALRYALSDYIRNKISILRAIR